MISDELPIEDSFKYRFKSQEDLETIKFFVFDRLKSLVHIKFGKKERRSLKEGKNLRF